MDDGNERNESRLAITFARSVHDPSYVCQVSQDQMAVVQLFLSVGGKELLNEQNNGGWVTRDDVAPPRPGITDQMYRGREILTSDENKNL
jgi:hypothetical protein